MLSWEQLTCVTTRFVLARDRAAEASTTWRVPSALIFASPSSFERSSAALRNPARSASCRRFRARADRRPLCSFAEVPSRKVGLLCSSPLIRQHPPSPWHRALVSPLSYLNASHTRPADQRGEAPLAPDEPWPTRRRFPPTLLLRLASPPQLSTDPPAPPTPSPIPPSFLKSSCRLLSRQREIGRAHV